MVCERKDIWRKWGKCRSDNICHSGLYFFCCGANDRLGGCGRQRPLRYGSGVFLKFSFLRVNINTLLYNFNFIHSKNSLPWSRGLKQLAEPRQICVFFFLIFLLFFIINRCTHFKYVCFSFSFSFLFIAFHHKSLHRFPQFYFEKYLKIYWW